MSRRAWITILSVGTVAGLILGTPLMCWAAECVDPSSPTCVGSGCDNLLGMSVPSGESYVQPFLIGIAIGIGAAWLVGRGVTKLHSRRT